MVKARDIITLYVIFCLSGALLEWTYGALWNLTGKSPWIYPDSVLRFTSFEGIPLWGLGGLICVTIYSAYTRRRWSVLLVAVPALVLAAIWVLFHGLVIR